MGRWVRGNINYFEVWHMKKIWLSLLLAVLAVPFAGFADPTPTPTPTETFTPTETPTWTPVLVVTPPANGISTSAIRNRSAEYVYDASVGRNGKVGPHLLKLVSAIGNVAPSKGAWIIGVFNGPIEKCFDDGGSSTFEVGTRSNASAFIGPTNTSSFNTCGTSDGSQLTVDAGDSDTWKRIGYDETTGAVDLNDTVFVVTIGGNDITQGKMHIVINYYQPFEEEVVHQGTLTPTPD